MASANAWFLDLGRESRVAVGEFEMVHILSDRPPLFTVPKSPSHCSQVFVWQDEVIPLMDIAAWLHKDRARSGGIIAVVAYQESGGALVRHGALQLADLPERARVHDEQACELDDPDLSKLAIACVSDARGVVPILDLPLLFTESLD